MHEMERNCQFITSIFGLLLCTGNYFWTPKKWFFFHLICIIFYFQRKETDSIVPARIEQLCLLHNCLVKMGDVNVQYIFNQFWLIDVTTALDATKLKQSIPGSFLLHLFSVEVHALGWNSISWGLPGVQESYD